MKHNYIKRLFTALLLLCSTVAMAHDFETDGIYYTITDAANKTVAVSYKGDDYISYSQEYSGSVVIPKIVCNRADGVYYGVMTLIQMFNQKTTDGRIAEVTISDYPDVEFRGYVEGFYGIPTELKQECKNRIPKQFAEALSRIPY